MWIRSFWQDFANSEELYNDLKIFADSISVISFGDNQKLVQAIREQVD